MTDEMLALARANAREAGVTNAVFISVEFTHEVADGMHAAIVKARLPGRRKSSF